MKKFPFFKAFSILFIGSNLVYFPFLKETASESAVENKDAKYGYVSANESGSAPKSKERFDKDAAVVIQTDLKPLKRFPKDTAVVLSIDATGKQKDSSKTVIGKMVDVASKNATPAAITSAGYKGFVSTNEGLSVKISDKLVKNRVTQEKAVMIAEGIAKAASSSLFRKTSVGVMAGGATYMVVQFFKEDCSLLEKISISVCIGLLAILLYSWLIRKKWMV